MAAEDKTKGRRRGGANTREVSVDTHLVILVLPVFTCSHRLLLLLLRPPPSGRCSGRVNDWSEAELDIRAATIFIIILRVQ